MAKAQHSGQLHDWVIVGSGFGGSVAALRLAEKGYGVVVLERGRSFADKDFANSAAEVGKLVWAPKLGLKGIMAARVRQKAARG